MKAEKQEFLNMVSESLLSKVQENEGGVLPDADSYGYGEKLDNFDLTQTPTLQVSKSDQDITNDNVTKRFDSIEDD